MLITGSAAVAALPDQVTEGGIMSVGWFMVLCMATMVLLFVVLILAIMAMIKWLFPRSNPFL